MVASVLLFHECYAPGQKIVGVIKHMPDKPGLRLRMLGAALVYDRTRANPRHFNATHWIGHASAMEHGTIFFDLKIPLQERTEGNMVQFSTTLPDSMLPSFSSAYNSAFVTVSYGLCLHSDTGEVLAVEPVSVTQNAPEESGRMNKKTRLATFVARSSSWYQHGSSSYLAATVDMDEVDNLTSGSTLSLRLHARSVQVKSLRFTVEQRLELSLPYDGQHRRVKQKAVIASSVRELSSGSPSEFKKRYFITMPTLCTTIDSPIISTKYTVRIQMTSARVPSLTLEVPVTMYSKGSFINGLPSPMSNPGLTPEWAKIILDSHQKRFVDECPICLNDLCHNFSSSDLNSNNPMHGGGIADDVASCGTVESEDAEGEQQGGTASAAVTATATSGKRDPAAANQQGVLPPLPASPLATYHAVGPGPGAASPGSAPVAADEGPGAGNWGGVAADDPVQEAEAAGPEDAMAGEHVDMLRLGEDGRSPDVIADEILAMKESHRSKEQLLLLYKTCRYREVAINHGVAYADCSHAFHPLCLLENEKLAAQQGPDYVLKCPLCRQEYTTRFFIPDANLRSLCLEHTISEAITFAETAAKEAEDKAKDAAHARSVAIEAARKAHTLRQRMGAAFCSPAMRDRLDSLLQLVNKPVTVPVVTSAPPHVTRHNSTMSALGPAAAASAGAPLGSLGPVLGARTDAASGDNMSAFVTPPATTDAQAPAASVAVPVAAAAGAAAAAAGAAAPADSDGTAEQGNRPPGSPLPGIDLGAQVLLHQQIASMRMSSDTEASALQHPEVVLDSEEAGDGEGETMDGM